VVLHRAKPLSSRASLAAAADLQISKEPPFLPPPPFSWTGFYLGGNVGAGFGTTETSVNVGPALTAVTGTPVDATAPLVSETFNGFVGGIQAGYNWQAGVFVLGVEGDLDAARLCLKAGLPGTKKWGRNQPENAIAGLPLSAGVEGTYSQADQFRRRLRPASARGFWFSRRRSLRIRSCELPDQRELDVA
jgi:opacity protein-like surface antigen